MVRDVVELVLAFEREFGLSVSGADAWQLATPRRMTDYVWRRMSHERLTREQVACWVRELVARQTSIEEFSDDAHFVRDLGLYC